MKKTYKTLTAVLSIVLALTVMCQPIEASAANAKPVVKTSQTVISKGTTTKVKVTYNKKNVTKKATYKSSNKKVATVSKKGVVTGKKAGTAYITATYKGRTSKRVKITVAQVSLNRESVKLSVGKTAALAAKYNKKTVRPAFRTSDKSVATVNKSGKITAKKAGTVTITAVYKKTKATCKVTVTGPAVVDHASKEVITKQPTCTEEGVKTFTCTCGDTWTEKIPALGHAWDAGRITKVPTETESGVKTYTCTRCGETKAESGHYEKKKVKDEWYEDKPYTVVVCNQCGAEFSELDYNGFEGAVEAWAVHSADSWDNGGNCDNYRNDVRTTKVHHDAEYEDVWVAD